MVHFCVQVDSEFCKRREMEKEMAELQVQLAKQAERTAAVRDVPLNGCAAGQTVKGVSRDSHDDGFQPSPLSDQVRLFAQYGAVQCLYVPTSCG